MNIQESIEKLEAKIESFFKPNPEISAELTKVRGELAQAQADLATAKASISNLTGQISTLKADAEKANVDHATALATKEADVEARAGAKAAEIVAKAGHRTPVKDEKPGSSADVKALKEQFAALTDPKARTEFWRQHKNALLAP